MASQVVFTLESTTTAALLALVWSHLLVHILMGLYLPLGSERFDTSRCIACPRTPRVFDPGHAGCSICALLFDRSRALRISLFGTIIASMAVSTFCCPIIFRSLAPGYTCRPRAAGRGHWPVNFGASGAASRGTLVGGRANFARTAFTTTL